MKIEIEIDENLAAEIAHKAALDAVQMTTDNFGGRSGSFYTAVKKQVSEQLAGVELRETIARIAVQRIDGIVTDAVTQELRQHIKQAAKEMRESGGLAALVKTHMAPKPDGTDAEPSRLQQHRRSRKQL